MKALAIVGVLFVGAVLVYGVYQILRNVTIKGLNDQKDDTDHEC